MAKVLKTNEEKVTIELNANEFIKNLQQKLKTLAKMLFSFNKHEEADGLLLDAEILNFFIQKRKGKIKIKKTN